MHYFAKGFQSRWAIHCQKFWLYQQRGWKNDGPYSTEGFGKPFWFLTLKLGLNHSETPYFFFWLFSYL